MQYGLYNSNVVAQNANAFDLGASGVIRYDASTQQTKVSLDTGRGVLLSHSACGTAALTGMPERTRLAVRSSSVRETVLTLSVAFPIVPAMFGLNQICGICREIIR